MGYPHYTPECHERWNAVTVCGSMRFFPQMLEVAADLTDQGHIVLMPFRVVAPGEQASSAKEQLDRLHRRKIDLCDSIVVVSDETGYIGDSTRGEIEYARSNRKEIAYRHVLGQEADHA